MADYDHIPPHASLKPSRFKVHIPQQQIDDFKKLLELSKVGPKTFENLREDGRFGISWEWLTKAKEYWLGGFDWRKSEARINSFTNYEVAIRDDEGNPYAIHFVGMFSKREDAIPIVLLHGWPGELFLKTITIPMEDVVILVENGAHKVPGSFLEFLDMLELLRGKYTPGDLPYHIIVPSLPGYAFSTGPSLTKEWGCEDMAVIVDKLMVGLGFGGSGYVAQGGDIGSRVARLLAVRHKACKAIHLNFNYMAEPKDISPESLTHLEQEALKRYHYTLQYSIAYAQMHGTRPATIGLVLSSSPLALLAWIGEKFLEWTDATPSLDTILESVTLYWLTSTQPRAIYTYVQESGDIDQPETSANDREIHSNPSNYCEKPMGYSWFPKDLLPVPISWVRTTGNLVWQRAHDEGGHFAAMEKPELLLQDLEDFVLQLQ